MRLEAQNDRQLRLALKLYWQMQKEDAVPAARPGEEAEETDDLLAELEKSLEVDPNSEPRSLNTGVVGDGQIAEMGPLETSNFPKRSHQVVENTGEVSGIGQNNPNLGIDGLTDGRIGGSAADHDQSAIDAPTRENSAIKYSIAAARAKVKELLSSSHRIIGSLNH